MEHPFEDWLTRAEAAQLLDVTNFTAYTYAVRFQWRTVQVGRTTLYHRGDVQAMKDQLQGQPKLGRRRLSR